MKVSLLLCKRGGNSRGLNSRTFTKKVVAEGHILCALLKADRALQPSSILYHQCVSRTGERGEIHGERQFSDVRSCEQPKDRGISEAKRKPPPQLTSSSPG